MSFIIKTIETYINGLYSFMIKLKLEKYIKSIRIVFYYYIKTYTLSLGIKKLLHKRKYKLLS